MVYYSCSYIMSKISYSDNRSENLVYSPVNSDLCMLINYLVDNLLQ